MKLILFLSLTFLSNGWINHFPYNKRLTHSLSITPRGSIPSSSTSNDDSSSPQSLQAYTSKQQQQQLLRQLFLGSLWTTSILMSSPSSSSGFILRETKNGAVGYEAAESAYAPMQSLYDTTPLLPQSALLNSLPLENKLIGQLQGFIESFIQLVKPSPQQRKQLASNTSALWQNLQVNAQRATGMCLYNEDKLRPIFLRNESSEMQALRFQYAEHSLEQLQLHLLTLVNVSRQCLLKESLEAMSNSLTSLADVAYYQLPYQEDDLILPVDPLHRDDDFLKELEGLPRLVGRAKVKLVLQKINGGSFKSLSLTSPSSGSGFNLPLMDPPRSTPAGGHTTEVTLVVDGIHHPYTAGHFIDLCQKDFFDNHPVHAQALVFKRQEQANLTLLGDITSGYLDPLTKKERRVPLEIYREEPQGEKGEEEESRRRSTAFGAARNTAFFTRARPVFSFATYGAIGMHHELGDGNGASGAFFFLPADRAQYRVGQLHALPAIQRLNNRFSLFAYAVEGIDALQQLQAGDVLVRTEVLEGAWRLLPGRR